MANAFCADNLDSIQKQFIWLWLGHYALAWHWCCWMGQLAQAALQWFANQHKMNKVIVYCSFLYKCWDPMGSLKTQGLSSHGMHRDIIEDLKWFLPVFVALRWNSWLDCSFPPGSRRRTMSTQSRRLRNLDLSCCDSRSKTTVKQPAPSGDNGPDKLRQWEEKDLPDQFTRGSFTLDAAEPSAPQSSSRGRGFYRRRQMFAETVRLKEHWRDPQQNKNTSDRSRERCVCRWSWGRNRICWWRWRPEIFCWRTNFSPKSSATKQVSMALRGQEDTWRWVITEGLCVCALGV